ncbi:MAG: hypothetical protein OQK82_07145 [Candidatus Pacearchaeota archaeon]|nr:hypothetical protein [Candidatus Pacearchaeota archaeon]
MKIELVEELQEKYKKFFDNNKKIFDFYWEGIILLKELSINIRNIIVMKTNESRKYASGTYAIVSLEQMKNLDYFNAHYHLLKQGFCLPAYMPIRLIFESLQRIYLYLVDNVHAENIYNYSIIQDFENMNSQEENAFEEYKRQRYYSYSKVCNLLYKDNKRYRLKEAYSRLSNRSHPTFKSASPSFRYSESAIKDVSETGQSMLSTNIWILFEIFGRYFNDELYKKTLNYLSKASPAFDLLPNKNNYINNLTLNSMEEFQRYLENPQLKSNLREIEF